MSACRCICLAMVAACAVSGAALAEGRRIAWDELRQSASAPASRTDRPSGPLQLDGQSVELTGYLLPADFDGDRVYSFLLLPEYGGCIHTPSPPADQIVLVTSATPFTASEIYQVVSVSGVLQAGHEQTQLFVLDGVKVVESGYRIGKAVVRESSAPVPAAPSMSRNPWQRLKRH